MWDNGVFANDNAEEDFVDMVTVKEDGTNGREGLKTRAFIVT